MIEINIVTGTGLYIITGGLFALAANALRQPLILAYLAAGVFLGANLGLGLLECQHTIETIADIGLILLLFVIGLEVDLKKLLASGRIIITAGVSQFLLCVTMALGFALLAGFALGSGSFDALYLAVALSLSSTMIVVKLLYDKFEMTTLPGQITLGILVFQDIWAIAFLALMPNLANPAPGVLAWSLTEGVLLVAVSLAASRYILPKVFASAASKPELVLALAIAWCFLVSGVAELLGLSMEMGALIAGVSLSTFPYNVDVIAKVTSIRDFFVILFFVSLGMMIPVPDGELLTTALAATAALVFIRFATIFPVLFGMTRSMRTSLIPCINLSQISEFSLVILTLGLGMGHVDQRLLSLVIIVFAITSVGSTYAIQYSYRVQSVLSRTLRALGLKDIQDEQELPRDANQKDIVFLGFYPLTSSILEELVRAAPAAGIPHVLDRALVMDCNIAVHAHLKKHGVTCVYGDLANMDTLNHADFSQAKTVVSTGTDTMLHATSNIRLLQTLKRFCPNSQKMLAAGTIPGALKLYEKGADFVYLPRLHSARQVAQAILAGLNGDMAAHGAEEVRELRERREILP